MRDVRGSGTLPDGMARVDAQRGPAAARGATPHGYEHLTTQKTVDFTVKRGAYDSIAVLPRAAVER